MELRHLRYFVAVAEMESFTQAAERLHISQPALSQRMRDLEMELELTLFAQKGRGFRLTPAGRYFLGEARQTLKRLEMAMGTAHRIESGVAGSLRVSTLEGCLGVEPIPSILKELRSRHPDLSVKLAATYDRAQYQAILAGQVDVGIVGHPPTDDPERALRGLHLMDLPVRAMLPASHRLAGRASLCLDDLAGEDFIWPEAGGDTSYWAVYREALKDRSWQPRVSHEASIFATSRALVAAGFGCALSMALPGSPAAPGVVQIPLQDIDLRIRVHLIWNPENPSPTLERFLHLTRDVLEDRLLAAEGRA